MKETASKSLWEIERQEDFADSVVRMDSLRDLDHVIESEVEALEDSLYGWLDADSLERESSHAS